MTQRIANGIRVYTKRGGDFEQIQPIVEGGGQTAETVAAFSAEVGCHVVGIFCHVFILGAVFYGIAFFCTFFINK